MAKKDWEKKSENITQLLEYRGGGVVKILLRVKLGLVIF